MISFSGRTWLSVDDTIAFWRLSNRAEVALAPSETRSGTIVRRELPIVVVVFDDAALSLIEIKQQPHHGGTGAVRYAPIDFAGAAEAMGMPAAVVTDPTELAAALDRHDFRSPMLIDARIDPASYPHLLAVTRGT